MSDEKREFAKEMGKILNWADIVGDPKKLKVEMFWQLYAQHVLAGVPVPAIQYQEMKQSYYVGFAECFKVMSDITEKYSEDEANDILTRLCKESNHYIESLVDRTLK